MKIIKVKAKTIFTKTKLPASDWVINQYVGCDHACSYCYAKFISRWKSGDYGKWGEWVEIKTNAPELVKNKYVNGLVFMSSVSDPYQSIEKDLKLTRQILESMDKKIRLVIQTKSDLILRDIDLLKQFKDIEIGFTINNLQKKLFEPKSPSNDRRIKALKILKEKGFKTYVFISPIIPNLIDLKDIILKTKNYADYYWFEFLNLKAAGKEFQQTLKREFPESYETLIDKREFQEFVKECKKMIKSQNIKVCGIEMH